MLLDTVQPAKVLYGQQEQHKKEPSDIRVQVTHIQPALPETAEALVNAAYNSATRGHWLDTIRYAQAALARGSTALTLYDALASAHGWLGQWDEARRYGLQALNKRDSQFGGEPVIPLPEPGPLPPPPSAQTRARNIIAFSLFGGDPRYCETAVLNVQEQPKVYPHWVCRFYIDASVPDSVIARLAKGGAQIVPVEGFALQWPGAMWRLLALNDPLAQRILFRDADSVISRREAQAVNQWATSGKRFHIMRDWAAYTDLMMAGLWGVVAGSLPPLEQLIQRFLSAPIQSRYSADQDFLRQYVWPCVRTSLMQHDSVFGSMDAVPFPDKDRPPMGYHVGYGEGAAWFTQKSDLLNGSAVVWRLYLIEKEDGGQTREELVCSYPGTVKEGLLKAHLPLRYVQRIKQGTACVRLTRIG
jgi:hypothetical protein